MCWIGEKSDKRIAKKDVKVFKILYWDERNACYHPPFYPENYRRGQAYRVSYLGKTSRENGFGLRIDYGFHCYSEHHCLREERLSDMVVKELNGRVIEYYEKGRREFWNYLPAKFVRCIIPVGTTYYENKSGEIVTPTIKIIGDIEYG